MALLNAVEFGNKTVEVKAYCFKFVVGLASYQVSRGDICSVCRYKSLSALWFRRPAVQNLYFITDSYEFLALELALRFYVRQ